ncbi:MAG: GTP 3',8-cyclase MoaA [Halomonas sp.]|nr:GTP 3',8-cyclase MoaA [Halomonas sp.]MBR2512560.1 GTP 3',8-cyclase MoaA [Halomonas sp.]
MSALVDGFGRTIRYLRLSVTDRCDFRCVYCMAEEMTFLPRAKLLTLEELATLSQAFVELGVEKIRLTGGEPLVRKGILSLVEKLGELEGLRELAMTTNGSGLVKHAKALRLGGLDRVNISLDSLKPERFKALTRTGELSQVISGIRAARQAGFTSIKLNAVLLKGRNDDEILDLVNFARDEDVDISFIEEMSLGAISEHNRGETFLSSDTVRETIEQHYQLLPTTETTLGPSRYYRMPGSASRIGFISPHSHNFCDACNRVRVTAEGRLLLCLGNEHSVDLRAVMRRYPGDTQRLKATIVTAMTKKPERHHFTTDGEVQILRFMNATGG